MKLKKAGLLVAAVCLSVAMLVGCSSDAAESTAPDSDVAQEDVADEDKDEHVADAEKSVEDMFEVVSAANAIANPRELTDMNIELDFMLNLDSVVSYKGVASNDGGDAGMVLVMEVAEGEADAVFAALETYADNQVLYWSNYAEFADAKTSAENSRIKRDGNYIIQVFAATGVDYADIETALTEAIG